MKVYEPLRMDEVPDETRPSCPACGYTMRRDLDTGDWRCDIHGYRVPLWVRRVNASP